MFSNCSVKAALRLEHSAPLDCPPFNSKGEIGKWSEQRLQQRTTQTLEELLQAVAEEEERKKSAESRREEGEGMRGGEEGGARA